MRVQFLAATAAAVLALATPGAASAADMDVEPERLVLQPANLPAGQTCQSMAANPSLAFAVGGTPENFLCNPANDAFTNIVSELGFAIAPNAMAPARTIGALGFVFTLEASFTSLNSKGMSRESNGASLPYWQLGTQGPQNPTTKAYSTSNPSPSSVLSVWMINARKGLPFGFQLGTAFGAIPTMTGMVIGGDLRWSPFEGFRTGALGYVPDIAVGAGVRTLAGAPKLYLTTASLDVIASKPIAIAHAATLTPRIGYQHLWIFGNSTILDLTPNTDALAVCGYQGSNPVTGEPVCARKLQDGASADYDFANNSTFNGVRVGRNRMLFGLTYNQDIVHVGAQFTTDVTNATADSGEYLASPTQWTIAAEAGVAF